MKLDELKRTQLEFISFKMGVLEEKIRPLQQEHQKLQMQANLRTSLLSKLKLQI